jgi:hypothetical protein
MRHFDRPLEFREMDGSAGDGRTVYGRVVPYGETIEFRDHDGTMKRERFVKGALANMVRSWRRVTLAFEHGGGFHNTIGYGRELLERDDGGYATFRLYERDADKAREMLTESHRGLSLEFLPMGRDVLEAGVILRQRVHVERVAVVTDPAYLGAGVLAVRSSDVEPIESEGTPNLDQALAILAEVRRSRS